MLPSLLISLIFATLTGGENPAIQVILNNKGLQYGKNVGAGWIQDNLKRVTLPDISGKISIGFLGSVGYTLTGVSVKQCDFPEPSVQFQEDISGFKSSISGLSVALTGGWRTHYGLIHDGGSFDLAVFDVDVTSTAKLGEDADGHLSISSVNCSADVGDIKMRFRGGASAIIQFFVDNFRGYIVGEMERHICPAVNQYIDAFEHHLQAMNVSFPVDPFLGIDLSLTNLPSVDASSLTLGLKGDFYQIKSHAGPPFKAGPFTLPKQPGFMMSVGFSEFTLNSASYVYFSAGLFSRLVNDSVIPPSSPFHLNTSSFGPYIPQLPKLFPDLLMSLQVYAREMPVFSLQPGLIRLGLLGSIKAFAIQPNATLTPLFKLNVDSKFSGKTWISDGLLKGSVEMDNLTLTLVSSEVGPFQVSKLAHGFDIPRMKHAQLVNTVLKVEEVCIHLSESLSLCLPLSVLHIYLMLFCFFFF
uniref:Bactericidal permeability-increasing protein n=1 Tax=Myripristis murdjan TaxID=586833 RepID=A0A667XV93_9TELE